MSKQPDPFRAGIERGWKITNGAEALPHTVNCDVAIVGTGAGAGITAELLTKAGLNVVLLEEGPLKTSTDFNQKESQAYADLYQEGGTRATLDKSLTILQGRCVGGTTVVNWTSSFRTPDATLKFWQEQYGLSDFTTAALAPWFEQAERRLNMVPWEVAPNLNNEILRTGAHKLGIAAHVIPRNVNACWNLGSCGLGCPTNAKQSMLVTTIPTALEAGAQLFYLTRAEKFEIENGEVKSLECVGVTANGTPVPHKTLRIQARHYVVAGGAINSPALLKRSKAPDPHDLLGKRTFLHPVAFSAAVFEQDVEPWAGAPQSIYVDHFLNVDPIDGPAGFKIEATPLHPGLASKLMGNMGPTLAARFKDYPKTQMMLSLVRDGFHPESAGGTVYLKPDGTPTLHYPLNDFVLDAFRRAMVAMAEIQFAAGAKMVRPVHEQAQEYSSLTEAKAGIAKLEMTPQMTGAGSAHVMGGCTMAGSEDKGVVRPDGLHWQVKNLSVHDGSVFPTSIGANPQLSIYGTVNRMATQLAKRLSGKDVSLA